VASDLLIRGGLIVDGTGRPGRRGDVAVRDGRIGAVGAAGEGAFRVIDATDLVVAPGFWDIHTHYDVQLLWDPIATSSCWHGVTTVVIGNCGFSVAPCRPQDQDYLVRTLARLEGMDVGVLSHTLPWAWGTFGEYLDALDAVLGVNVIPQVGHMAVRRYVMGEEASRRAARSEEVAQMRGLVVDALEAGAFGFSTSRAGNHWDGDGQPVPSRAATVEEYMTLVAEMARLPVGFVQLLAPQFTWEQLAQAAQVARRPLCLNAIVQQMHKPEAWKEDLARMLEMRARGFSFFAQGHCQAHDFEVTFQSTDVFDRYPTWKSVLEQPHDRKKALLRDPATRQKLKAEMSAEKASLVPLTWDRFLLVRSATGRYRQYEGQRVEAIAEAMGKHPLDAALDIAVDEDLATHLRVLDARNLDPQAMLEILRTPHIVPGPSDAGAHVLRGVNTGFPTRLLGHWVRERHALTLEEAVCRLSSLPAQEMGVTDRGTLEAGKAADITIFDPRTVASTDRLFANDLPGGGKRLIQHAAGVEYLIVNGCVTMQRGQPTGDRAGATLRSGAYRA